MSSQRDYTSSQPAFDTSTAHLSITGQMLTGLLLAIVAFGGPLVFILFFWFIGTLLPPESKEADDPTPNSFSHYEGMSVGWSA